MSSLSTSLKNSYQKWLHPYEEYLRVAKPGVQQQLEFEYGGPFMPSSANSPMKKPPQDATPILREHSPPKRASAAFSSSIKDPEGSPEKPPPVIEHPPAPTSSSFTAVNSGGFTPVNLTQASFQAVNTPSLTIKREAENGTPNSANRSSSDGRMSAPKDTPEYRNSNLGPAYLTNGHGSNPLKRTISYDSLNGGVSGTDSGIVGDGDDQNGRRSKRLKKGICIPGPVFRTSLPQTPLCLFWT